MNKISVLIPAFNAEKFIEQTVDSVLSQTYQNFEIIIINDGSTDNTLNIIEKLSLKDNRIRFYSQDNGGVSSARNLAIKMAIGDWIFILDSDDYLHPSAFSECMNATDIEFIDVFESNYIYDTGSGLEYPKQYFKKDKLINADKMKCILLNNIFSPLLPRTLLIRKKIIDEKEIRYNTNFKIMEDVDFFFEILQYAKHIKIFANRLYHYRINPNSLTHKEDYLLRLEKNIFFFCGEKEKFISRDKHMCDFCDSWYLRNLISYYRLMIKSGNQSIGTTNDILEDIRKTRFCLKFLPFKDKLICIFGKFFTKFLNYIF